MKKLGAIGAFAGVLVLLAVGIFAPTEEEQPDPLAAVKQENAELRKRIDALEEKKDRVIQLPEDGEIWYTTLIYTNQRTDDASRNLAAMVATTPRLQSLMAQTRTNTWTESNSMYVHRYKRMLGGEVPAIIVQNHTGKVCYKASGGNLPNDGETLADEIAIALEQCWPRPKPGPDNRPATPETPAVSVVPDIRPTQPESPSGGTNPLLFILPVLAAGAGIYQQLRASVS